MWADNNAFSKVVTNELLFYRQYLRSQSTYFPYGIRNLVRFSVGKGYTLKALLVKAFFVTSNFLIIMSFFLLLMLNQFYM